MSKGNKVVSVRFSKELTEKLEAEARMRGVSVSKLCKKIVIERVGGIGWGTGSGVEPVKVPPEEQGLIARWFWGD